MSGQEAYEREYIIFHSDGPIMLTEHELLNDYMKLRHGAARVEALEQERDRLTAALKVESEVNDGLNRYLSKIRRIADDQELDVFQKVERIQNVLYLGVASEAEA